MRLFAEIGRALGAEAGERISFTVIGGRGGYFENVKRIAAFSREELVLVGRKDGVKIEGSGLELSRYGGGDVAVRGEIASVKLLSSKGESA